MNRQFLLLALFFTALCALSAQKKESLAVFPFTGGNASDGEAIAASLARQPALRNAFNKTTLITRSNIAALNFEQRFQRDGLTDADTIFELGKKLSASHVIAGYITKLGNNNLVLISIMDIESLQQIAGDYRTYSTIEEIDRLYGDIAQKLASAVTRNTSGLPGLSVPPFTLLSGASRNDAMVLAQILSCDLANGNRYAVLPRTDSIDKVLEEHQRQRSGETDQTRTKLLGAGRNAQYVLSGSVQRLGTNNKIAVDILDIVDGSMVDEPYEERYSDLSDSLVIIPKMAFNLNNPRLAAANNFLDKGEWDNAIKEYTEVIRANPNYADAYRFRGNSYFNKRDYDRAIADYTQAIRINPNYFEAYYNRGNAYFNKGDYDRAYAEYTQALRINPGYANAYNNRGRTYYLKKDDDRAIADFTEAIRINPNFAEAYNNRGRAYDFGGKNNLDQAIADYSQAIKIDPNYANAYSNLGFLYYLRKRDYDRAIENYSQVIRLRPNDDNGYAMLGHSHYGKKNYSLAITNFTEAIRIKPDGQSFSRSYYYHRGEAFYYNWNYRNAIEDFTAAIRIDGETIMVYEMRGKSYEAIDDMRNARADYARARRILNSL